MSQIEPMDIDSISNDFDDKENSLQISNVLPRTPCTEKGYEELDVSELNMKLRYSITPASSPMSRSYTANCRDNKIFNLDEDSLNNTILNDNLTRSLNSTIKCDVSKSPKLPLQVLSTDSMLQRSLDNDPNVTITVNGTYNIDENLSLPSTSSSTVQTPEATTPTKDIPKDGGSPIMRGLKSVLNMFRTSQSPIPHEDTLNKELGQYPLKEDKSQAVLVSTPKANKSKDSSPKRSSPLKDSVVFKDDLERQLLWKDDSTIIFKEEKIPIHKLYLQQSTSLALEKKIANNLNTTVEYMDMSYNDSIADKTMADLNNIETVEISGVDSEGEFLDCETTYKQEKILDITVSEKSHELKDPEMMSAANIVSNSLDLLKNEQHDNYNLNKVKSNSNLFCDNVNIKSELDRDKTRTENDINLGQNSSNCGDLNIADNAYIKSDHLNNTTNIFIQNLVSNEIKVLENTPEEHNLISSLNEEINVVDVCSNESYTQTSEGNQNLAEDMNVTMDVTDNIYSPYGNQNRVVANTQMENKLASSLPYPVSEELNMACVGSKLENDTKNFDNNIKLVEDAYFTIGIIDNNQVSVLENTQEENKLTTLQGSQINKVIDLEEKPLNVAVPLNIETDYIDIDLMSVDKDSNNIDSHQNQDDKFLNESSMNFNSGILQICTNESENYIDSVSNNGHEHANTQIKHADIYPTILEINKIDENFIEDREKGLLNVIYSDEIKLMNENNISSNVTELLTEIQGLQTISVASNDESNSELLSYKADDVETFMKDDTFVVKDESSDLKIAKDDQSEVTSINIDSQNVGIKDINDTTILQDIAISILPADVPLPSDEEIFKDSLTDSICVIKNNEINEKYIEHSTFRSRNKAVDNLKATDVSETSVVPTESFEKVIETVSTQTFNETLVRKTNFLTSQNDLLSNEIKIQQPHRSNSEADLNNKCYTLKETFIVSSGNLLATHNDILNNETKIPQEPSILSQPVYVAETPVKEINLLTSQNDAYNKTKTPQEPPAPLPKEIYKEYVIIAENITNLPEQSTEETQKMIIDDTTVKINTDIQKMDKLDEINIINENIDTLNNIIDLKENIEDEIVTSNNTSPFVSVNDLTKNDIEFERPFETKSKMALSPTISPELARKGYNINFDEIADPFATKTNIRMSPTSEISPRCKDTENLSEKKIDVQKKTQQNRRKSQSERQKRDVRKNKLNNSYSHVIKPNIKDQIQAQIENTAKNEIENKKIDLDCTNNLLTIEADSLNPVINKCVADDSNVINNVVKITEEDVIVNKKTEIPIEDNSFANKHLPSWSPDKEFPVKNVFNLPEIDDINFNPFVTKSKMRKSPSPALEKENSTRTENEISNEIEKEMLTQAEKTHTSSELLQTESTSNDNNMPELRNISSETCSSKTTDKEFKVREVNTEDEDTVEGPFLEADDFSDVVKITDFGAETDMMQFDLPTDIANKEDDELFIDAEAFEFLLNQNKNVVADSGKESLFLKFDPLFAKRVSSDGVLAALNRINKRQSTPKKPPTPAPRYAVDDDKPTSSLNLGPTLEESIDEANATLPKPMMVVNPAVNSLISPRKSTTPKINRRSLTFTSPAIAVIDRLLSLSCNSSTLDHETTTQNREYNETDIALTQLRELLAEKEIHVHNLRSESKELKERLVVMELQVKSLEKESEQRFKKVNDLNECLTEKTQINKSMAVVVEEYERTIASLISEMEQEKRRNSEERSKLICERDEQTAHLASMEVSFSDLHSKYEKSKQIILSMKAHEDTYKKSIKEFEDNLLKMQNNYELLKQHATSKLNHANQELEKFNRAHESEVLKLSAMIKRKELHITSLEESLAQKTKANEELTAICDELINKVG